MSRTDRINSLIHQELSQIFLKKIDFPRDCLVTITTVDTSSDNKKAVVWVSVLPNKKIKNVFKILNKKTAFIQHLLNKAVPISYVPKIVYQLDKGETAELSTQTNELEQLLDQIKDESD